MKKTEINFINMTDAVCSGFDAEQGAWSGKEPIVVAVGAVKAYRSEIEGLAYDQAEARTTGETQKLKSSQNTMIDQVFGVILKLRPFATVNNDQKLLAEIDFAKSELEQCKQMDCLTMCRRVYQRGIENQGKMNGYELTDAVLEAVGSSINGFAMLSGNRDAMIGAGKTATEGIPVCIDKIRIQLEMLDDLVPALISNETFVQNYKNNRRIIDR